eukprot:scaffold1282_cov251-Pinguiococcus_pyrenoidosus.AAC.68
MRAEHSEERQKGMREKRALLRRHRCAFGFLFIHAPQLGIREVPEPPEGVANPSRGDGCALRRQAAPHDQLLQTPQGAASVLRGHVRNAVQNHQGSFWIRKTHSRRLGGHIPLDVQATRVPTGVVRAASGDGRDLLGPSVRTRVPHRGWQLLPLDGERDEHEERGRCSANRHGMQQHL